MISATYTEDAMDIAAETGDAIDENATITHPLSTAIGQLLETKVPELYPSCYNMPQPINDASLRWVATPVQLAALATDLEASKASRIAVDMEAHSQHTYSGLSCLIQISTGTYEVTWVVCCMH